MERLYGTVVDVQIGDLQNQVVRRERSQPSGSFQNIYS